MKKLFITALLSNLLSANVTVFKEHHYQKEYCDNLNGKIEVVLTDKTRIDCLTKDKAIEVDFTYKWAECIGQALHYGYMTNKQPVCALIVTDLEKDKKYITRVCNIAKHINLEVDIIKPE